MGVHSKILLFLLNFGGGNVIIKLREGTGEEDIIIKDPNLKQRKSRYQDSIQTVFCTDFYVGYTYNSRWTYIILHVYITLYTHIIGGLKTRKRNNSHWKVTDSVLGN